jgi:hypothetical protein
MVFIGLVLAIAFGLSLPATRRMLPFESFLAVVVVGGSCIALFQLGRLS